MEYLDFMNKTRTLNDFIQRDYLLDARCYIEHLNNKHYKSVQVYTIEQWDKSYWYEQEGYINAQLSHMGSITYCYANN